MTENNNGPIYGIELIDNLPLGSGGMLQAMPSRDDLIKVRRVSERTAAGYEVLLKHYRQSVRNNEELDRLRELAAYLDGGSGVVAVLREVLDRMQQMATLLDNPEVLLRIPQPQRIKLSQLLHGAERFCDDCGEPLEPGYIVRKCPMCEEDERKQQRST